MSCNFNWNVGDSIKKFVLLKELGEGAFGKVFLAKSTDGTEVALKIDYAQPKSKSKKKNTSLFWESTILQKIRGEGIPRLLSSGPCGVDGQWFLAMERLGLNLEQWRVYCGGKFSLCTTLGIALQLVIHC